MNNPICPVCKKEYRHSLEYDARNFCSPKCAKERYWENKDFETRIHTLELANAVARFLGMKPQDEIPFQELTKKISQLGLSIEPLQDTNYAIYFDGIDGAISVGSSPREAIECLVSKAILYDRR